jgi:hypothetical protein
VYRNEDTVSTYVYFFEMFETSPTQICAYLLEIRINKKNQMSMDVNKKYCQSCHLIISRNGLTHHYENNELTDMLLMYGQCYQNAAAASRL